MKNLLMVLMLGLLITGCSSYTSVTKLDKKRVAVTKNDGFLFGLLWGPKVYVCTATTNGLTDCATKENP